MLSVLYVCGGLNAGYFRYRRADFVLGNTLLLYSHEERTLLPSLPEDDDGDEEAVLCLIAKLIPHTLHPFSRFTLSSLPHSFSLCAISY